MNVTIVDRDLAEFRSKFARCDKSGNIESKKERERTEEWEGGREKKWKIWNTIPGNLARLVRQVSRQRGARACRIVAGLPQPVHFPFPADWHRRFAIYGPRSAADYPAIRTANQPCLIRQSIMLKRSCFVRFVHRFTHRSLSFCFPREIFRRWQIPAASRRGTSGSRAQIRG